jgi:tellurium resistance protein TerZ
MSISLVKGNAVSLEKASGESLSKIAMGLRWKSSTTQKTGFFGRTREVAGRSVDLDASCLAFDGSGEVLETIWFRNLRGKKGAIEHTGDDTTGRGRGADLDNEVIHVDLRLLSAKVTSLVFTVNSYSGESFAEIQSAGCRLVDLNTGTEFGTYELGVQGTHKAMIMAKVQRGSDGIWSVTMIGEPVNRGGRTVESLEGPARDCL